MSEFDVEVFQNKYLPPGGTKVDAIVAITARAGGSADAQGSPRTRMVEVIVVDASGSMQVDRKMEAAQAATKAAIDALHPSAWFAVVTGREEAQQVFPEPGRLAPATAEQRDAAKTAVRRVRAQGGTQFGRWLDYVNWLVRHLNEDRRHAILLTDGINEEPPGALEATLRACKGQFECDCRGIGAHWRVDELRMIATTLLGTVDIIPGADQMEGELRSLMQKSMGKHASAVAIELVTAPRASVEFVKQVMPSVEDVSDRRVTVDSRTGRYPVGSWGDETRSFHVRIDVPAQHVGDAMRVAEVRVLVGDGPVGKGSIVAEWTDVPELSTRIDKEVAHYTGQALMAGAIDNGIKAMQAGDRARAEADLGRALQLAHEAGNEDTIQLLKAIAEHADPVTGTIRLRPQVDAVAERTLEAESTKTIALRREQP